MQDVNEPRHAAVEEGATDPAADGGALIVRQVDEIVSSHVQREPAIPNLRMREALDREEREIKDNVLRMGSLVAEQINAAINALQSHDTGAATAVIIGDSRLNEVQRSISSLIARTIATQQPVARDLRFLLALDHVGYELERMGDHAASVAKQVRRLSAAPVTERHADLKAMGDLCGVLVHGTLRALVD